MSNFAHKFNEIYLSSSNKQRSSSFNKNFDPIEQNAIDNQSSAFYSSSSEEEIEKEEDESSKESNYSVRFFDSPRNNQNRNQQNFVFPS